MMRISPRYDKRSDDYNDNNNTIADTRADADEEAQLFKREELGFEDGFLLNPKLRRYWRNLLDPLRGPKPPRIQTIRPIFPRIQRGPLWAAESHGANKKVWLVLILLFWLLIASILLSVELPLRDGDGNHVVNLDCVDTLWSRKNECGLNGIDCRPFSNQSFTFRCPAECSAVRLLNPHMVGPVQVNYRPLVIGSGTYRGDSFICASAIHAGIFKDHGGGCGRITLFGDHDNFPSTKQYGIESVAYDSYFPKSFSIAVDNSFRCPPDLRLGLLCVSIYMTFAIAIFSTSPIIFFPIFTVIFAHVAFASDPPTASHLSITVLPDHISMFTKRLLPAFFIAVVIYITTVKRTLSGLTAQYEKALLWVGGFWIGALSNYTFDWIPLARLTKHDLEQQPGAKLALAIIILILAAIVVSQAYSFWLEGRLPRYLALYGLFISGIIICLMIPGVNLRIHHYILALLFLPGTSLQTRPSLLYQGILLGLFVNGVARWDFDSILQTSEALLADAQLGSVIPPILQPTINADTGSLVATFAYGTPPGGVDGISVLVNDVERDRFFFNDAFEGDRSHFKWTRPESTALNEYFRFAYVMGGRTLDFSAAGTWFSNGTWSSERT